MSYEIIHNDEYGYYEGYINGMFFCTGDNHKEVAEEIENYLAERR